MVRVTNAMFFARFIPADSGRGVPLDRADRIALAAVACLGYPERPLGIVPVCILARIELMKDTPQSNADLIAENQRLLRRIEELEASQVLGVDPRAADQALRAAISREALGGSFELRQSIEVVTETLLEIFDCDRAWVLHPEGLDTGDWDVPIEVRRPEWSNACSSEHQSDVCSRRAFMLAAIEDSEGTLVMSRADCEAANSELVANNSVQSQIMTRLEPGHGEPWILGMQQCSHERAWTSSDRELLDQVTTQITELLTNLLAHQDLAEREERLKLALESAGDGAWDWNVETGAVVFSENLWDILGYEPGELEPHVESWMALIHPGDMASVQKALDAHLSGVTESYSCEHRLRTKAGGWLWSLGRGRVVTRSPSGEPLRMTGTHTDISRTKQTEEMLLRERRLFTGGPCIVFRWVAAEGWPVEYVSPNVSSLFGHSAEDFMSGRVPYAGMVHPDELERVGAEVAGHSASGVSSFEQEYRIVNSSGEERWIYDFTIVHRNDEGEVTHFEGYVLDATDRRQAEERRSVIEGQMKEAQKLESLGVLAGGIAHDFNNLLVGMLGHAELAMSDTVRSSAIARNLRGIIVAANQAAELTQQMLAYSGRGACLLEGLNVNQIIKEMTRLLAVSVSKTADLRLDLASDIPAVNADGSQLRQVIMNLIMNAAEAVGDNPGEISITTGTMLCDSDHLRAAFHAHDLPSGRYVFVEVEDTGEGMDSETVARIFDPFFTTKFTGRGLGLAAVQGIVRGHSGGIRVTSEIGQGTVFKVVLPASTEPAETVRQEQPAEDWEGSGTILVVDDEETVRDVTSEMLKTLGFTALVAKSGAEAIEIFKAHKGEIDCVVLDLTMPGLSGEEVFHALREIDPDVRVILSSGYSEADIVQRFSGKGLTGFMHKPYGREVLFKALVKALSRSDSR